MMYPTYIVDNFFDNPEAVVELANSLPFPNKGDTSPGARTDLLHDTQHAFFNWSCLRMLSTIFPDGKTNFNARAQFQRIPQTVSEVDFIHQDTHDKLTAIVYLNKKDTNGTSLFKPKTFETVSSNFFLNVQKYNYYKSPEKYKGDKLKKLKREKEALRDKFNETVSVSGVYNRLFMFDGHQYHSQHPNRNKEERLTYIVFFSRIESRNAHKLDVEVNKPLEIMRKT